MKLPDFWDDDATADFDERIAINSEGSQLPLNALPDSIVKRSVKEVNEMFGKRFLDKK